MTDFVKIPRNLERMDLRRAEFPSDAISIKRLRKVFPEGFEPEGFDLDNHFSSFFFPAAIEKPEHLVRLTDLLSCERRLALGAFRRECEKHLTGKEMLSEEDRELFTDARQTLIDNHLFFKLADSLETAQMLVASVESQGAQQAREKSQQAR
jgi:hypothetical protein